LAALSTLARANGQLASMPSVIDRICMVPRGLRILDRPPTVVNRRVVCG
jgi:hypothetical protein